MRVNGHAVKAWREERGLTVTALAQAVGAPQPHLSRVEHGEREASFDLLGRVARVLAVDPKALVGPDEDLDSEFTEEKWPHRRGGNRASR